MAVIHTKNHAYIGINLKYLCGPQHKNVAYRKNAPGFLKNKLFRIERATYLLIYQIINIFTAIIKTALLFIQCVR